MESNPWIVVEGTKLRAEAFLSAFIASWEFAAFVDMARRLYLRSGSCGATACGGAALASVSARRDVKHRAVGDSQGARYK